MHCNPAHSWHPLARYNEKTAALLWRALNLGLESRAEGTEGMSPAGGQLQRSGCYILHVWPCRCTVHQPAGWVAVIVHDPVAHLMPHCVTRLMGWLSTGAAAATLRCHRRVLHCHRSSGSSSSSSHIAASVLAVLQHTHTGWLWYLQLQPITCRTTGLMLAATDVTTDRDVECRLF
jgi:hypothetical protein